MVHGDTTEMHSPISRRKLKIGEAWAHETPARVIFKSWLSPSPKKIT